MSSVPGSHHQKRRRADYFISGKACIAARERDLMPLLADAYADESRQKPPVAPALPHPHVVSGDEVLGGLQSSRHGLSRQEAMARLERFGRNTLPRPTPQGVVALFFGSSSVRSSTFSSSPRWCPWRSRSGPTPSSSSLCC